MGDRGLGDPWEGAPRWARVLYDSLEGRLAALEARVERMHRTVERMDDAVAAAAQPGARGGADRVDTRLLIENRVEILRDGGEARLVGGAHR